MQFHPHVGSLTVRLQDGDRTLVKIRNIYQGQTLDFGRGDITAYFGTVHKTISKHHFQIRCIVFDEDDLSVSPMVYLHVLSANGLLMWNNASDQGQLQLLTQSDGARLLNSGDTFRLTRTISVTFDAFDGCSLPQAPITQQRTLELVCKSDLYQVTDSAIGTGAYARVLVAKRNSDGAQLACKVIPTVASAAISQQRWRAIVDREVQILRTLDHPNIISVSKVLTTRDNIYIMQELATGGDLLSFQHAHGVMKEPDVICLMYQLVRALHYLHSIGLVHRDIKPENILLTSWQPGSRILLTDFGQARHGECSTAPQPAPMRMASVAGTEGWQAPELRATMGQSGSEDLTYGEAVDMWSCGCVAFACFTNNRPDTSAIDDLHHAQEAHTKWPYDVASHLKASPNRVSKRAVAFIQECLAIDEHSRLISKAAALHPWFTCPLYHTELQLAYERAVSCWTPRQCSDHIVEHCEIRCQDPSDLSFENSLLAEPPPLDMGHHDLSLLEDFLPPSSTQMH